MERTTIQQDVNFYRPELREIVEMIPIINLLKNRKHSVTLTKDCCDLLYKTLTKIGFISTETSRSQNYEITIQESPTVDTHQKTAAIKVIAKVLNIKSVFNAKDIIDKKQSITCTATQFKTLSIKLKLLGYVVNTINKE